MQKTLRNIFLLSIVLFICNMGKIGAEAVSESAVYVDASGIPVVTCYSGDTGVNATCRYAQELNLEFYGNTAERSYKNYDTAPNTVCFVYADASGMKMLYDRDCSQVEGYDATNDIKQTLTKQQPSGEQSCRYETQMINDALSFTSTGSGTVLNNNRLTSRYDGRVIEVEFDGSNCLEASSGMNNCRPNLYYSCENCDALYGPIKINVSFERRENYSNFTEFRHAIGCTGNDCVQINEGENKEELTNCNIFGDRITDILKQIIDLIQLAVPIIIIILTIIDFVGIVLSGEDKNFKAAGSKLIKRLIIGAAIIFLPMLLAFIIDMSGALAPYGIERNQLFCSLF